MVARPRTGGQTIDDFERLIAQPENADRRFELIDGRIVEKVPTQLHAAIVYLLAGYFFLYLDKNPVGRAYVEARYQLPNSDDNARVPDFSFVSGFDRPIVEQGPAPYMPDLVVEVQSPDDTPEEMTAKAHYYLANDTHIVWIVYPKLRSVEVFTAAGRQMLTENDTLTGGDVLPGLSFPVKAIFPA